MKVTIQEIADKVGVSRGTVDRALNNRGRIKPEVAENILQIANELGYKPPQKKKSKLEPTHKIGIVTQLSKSSFMMPVRSGIIEAMRVLKSRNIECLLKEIDGVDEEAQLQALIELEKDGVSAIALMPVESDTIRKKIDELTEKGIIIATFNSDSIGSRRAWFIGLDNEQSGQAAAGLMGKLTQGKGKILAITGYFGNSVSGQRVDGFVKRLKDFPELDLIGVKSSFDDTVEVQEIVLDALETYEDLSGLVIFSGGQKGVYQAFEQLNLEKRPYVIVYDITSANIEALTNNRIDFLIDQDGFRQGYQVLILLAEQLIKKNNNHQEYHYTDIIIKTSDNI